MVKEKLIGLNDDEITIILNTKKGAIMFHKWWRAEGEKRFYEWQKKQK